MKLVIDREKWGRGPTGGSLLNEDGKMCCLGFAALSCGFKSDDIRGFLMPRSVKGDAKKNKKIWAILTQSKVDSSPDILASTNDHCRTTDRQKESAIKKEFKKIGVEVVFKN